MLLKAGETCWRTATADRAKLLMENSSYFTALHQALRKAQRSIHLLGWQFDPRTRLDPTARGEQAAPIGNLLRLLVKERPDLDVRLLIWKSPLLIAASQGFYPQKAMKWFQKRTVELRLDRPRPFGACHHQKVVVIDDRLAFCGGGDVSVDRWDSCEHLDDDPRRMMPSGLMARPRHEVMMMVDGAAAGALGELFRERWQQASGERLKPVVAPDDPWPEEQRADVRGVTFGLARSEPAWKARAAVRENEALHLAAIARASRLIYLENQYLTSPVIAAALAQRLEEPVGPEVVIVSTGRSPSWFDQSTMDAARRALLARLAEADRYGRLSAWKPLTRRGLPIVVHSKVTVIDDVFLRVGSANLNNRSAGFDTEADVAIECGNPDSDTGIFIQGFRRRLLAHFLGADEALYDHVEAVAPSVRMAIEAFNDGGRLCSLLGDPDTAWDRFAADFQIGDPSTTADSWRPWKRLKLMRELRIAVEDQAGSVSSKSITSGR